MIFGIGFQMGFDEPYPHGEDKRLTHRAIEPFGDLSLKKTPQCGCAQVRTQIEMRGMNIVRHKQT